MADDPNQPQDNVELFHAHQATRQPQPLPLDSEEALAQAYVAQYGDDMRYVASWNQWLIWDGCRWAPDQKLQSITRSRKLCKAIAGALGKMTLARKITAAKTVMNVISLARADERVAIVLDQLDADPWLLNTPDGTINLGTGRCYPWQRGDLITKRTSVGPGGACPAWLAFLNRITDADGHLVGFLQRMAGYALTGSTTEHALYFMFGTGRNGKTTFLNVLSQIMGDYATTAPMEAFTASHGERHPTELAGLRGARLVTAVETEEGRRWNESRIKALTGGDAIAARFMRQDWFTFTPQFKLMIAGNHKPGLRSVDEAIRRRMNLLPFTVTIPIEEVDPQLPERLKGEWPGILQWAIDGCLDWQSDGMRPPDCVTEATSVYLDSQDALQYWLDECCELKKSYECTGAEAFKSWAAWAERNGEIPGSRRKFSESMETRGFKLDRIKTARIIRGLRVIATREGW